MKKLMVGLGVAFATSVSAFAADVTFTNVDKRGDLADPLAWGRTVEQGIPSETDRLQLVWNSNGNGIWATKDLTFAGLRSATSAYTMNLDMRNEKTGADPGPRKITLTAGFDAIGNVTMNFKGGFWDVTGSMLANWSGVWKVVLSDAAKMQFTDTVAPGYQSNGSSLTIKGGSVLTTKRLFAEYTFGKNAVVKVLEGSTVSVGTDQTHTGDTTVFYTDNGNGNSGDNNGIVVADAGSRIDVKGYGVVGGCGNNSYLYITNGGQVAVSKRLSIGSSNASNKGTNAVVRVADPGSSLSANVLVVGTDEKGAPSFSSLFVENGATVTAGDFRIGGYDYSTTDDQVVVSNANLTVTSSFLIGHTNNNHSKFRRLAFRAIGKETRLTLAFGQVGYLFGPVGDSLFELDGVAITNANGAIFGVDNTNSKGGNVVRLKNGAEFKTSSRFLLAGVDYLTAGGNALFVESGSRIVSGAEIGTSQGNNMIVVSNGVLQASGGLFVPIVSSSKNVPQEGQTNDTLRIAGTTPYLSATNGTLSVKQQSHLVFDYPVEGYAEGHVPVKVKKMELDSDCDLAVNVPAEACEAFEGTRNVKLVETTGGITISSAILEAAKAKLPPKCDLYVRDNSLWLKAKGKPLGMLLLVR